MSVARVSKITSQIAQNVTLGLDEAIKRGIFQGNRELRDVRIWWIKEQRVTKGSVSEYHVNLMIGFVIDE